MCESLPAFSYQSGYARPGLSRPSSPHQQQPVASIFVIGDFSGTLNIGTSTHQVNILNFSGTLNVSATPSQVASTSFSGTFNLNTTAPQISVTNFSGTLNMDMTVPQITVMKFSGALHTDAMSPSHPPPSTQRVIRHNDIIQGNGYKSNNSRVNDRTRNRGGIRGGNQGIHPSSPRMEPFSPRKRQRNKDWQLNRSIGNTRDEGD